MNLKKDLYTLTLIHLIKIIIGQLHLFGEKMLSHQQKGAVCLRMTIHKKGLLSRLFTKLKKRKRFLLASVLWALAIVLIIIRVHWFFYQQNPRFRYTKVPFSYEGPQMGSIDLLILGIISVLFGTVLAEADSIFYGYFIALILSFIGLVIYVTLYIWFVLGWGELLSLIPGTTGLQWAIFWAILNIAWIMFPPAVLICLFGAIAGGFLRSWLKP